MFAFMKEYFNIRLIADDLEPVFKGGDSIRRVRITDLMDGIKGRASDAELDALKSTITDIYNKQMKILNKIK